MELLVVLAVSAIAAAIAVPRYATATARYRANFAARRVAADLELAAASARNGSSNRTVTFDAGSRCYTIEPMADLDRKERNYRVQLDVDPYAVTSLKAEFGTDATVVFDGYGTPDAAGTVRVEVGPVSKLVSLDATGKASVQ
jgi:type II secretory pathway pseudopilin PulG